MLIEKDARLELDRKHATKAVFKAEAQHKSLVEGFTSQFQSQTSQHYAFAETYEYRGISAVDES